MEPLLFSRYGASFQHVASFVTGFLLASFLLFLRGGSRGRDQNHLPPKFRFSSDFGLFILEMGEKKVKKEHIIKKRFEILLQRGGGAPWALPLGAALLVLTWEAPCQLEKTLFWPKRALFR